MIVVSTPTRPNVVKFITMGVNFATTGDTVIGANIPFGNYVIDTVEVWSWSATPGALLAFTIRDTAAGSGNALATAAAGLNVTISGLGQSLELRPIANTLGSNRVLTNPTVYLNVSIANLTALTGNVTLYLRTLD